MPLEFTVRVCDRGSIQVYVDKPQPKQYELAVLHGAEIVERVAGHIDQLALASAGAHLDLRIAK